MDAERQETRSGRPAGGVRADHRTSRVQGVGARQADLFAPAGGGGYLDECNPSELSKRDIEAAKIRELEAMGLAMVWLRVARSIGYENFVELWRILDTSAEQREMRLSDNESMIEVQMRRFASFRRFQRNRFIETLAADGLPALEIQMAVKGQLGESLTRNHIVRIARRGKIGGWKKTPSPPPLGGHEA